MTDNVPDFPRLAPYVSRVLEILLKEPTFKLLNVNIPAQPKGLRWTSQSCRQYDGRVVPASDPMGRPIFWFTVKPIQETEEGTDRWALEHDFVSITPLRLDLTSERELAEAQARIALE